MSQISIPNQVTCASLPTIGTISPFECIGDSLSTINNNFSKLQANQGEICTSLESTIDTVESIVIAPVQSVVAWSGEIRSNAGGTLTGSTLTTGTTAFIWAKQANGSYAMDRNWALCTGAVINGIATPDLIGRFIIGAGNPPTNSTWNDSTIAAYETSLVGGKEAITLNAANIPKLTQSVTFTGQATKQFVNNVTYGKATGKGTSSSEFVTHVEAPREKPEVEVSGEVRVGSPTPSNVSNLPPYRALYYIIRVS